MTSQLNFERELLLLTEAHLIELNIPCKRRFTHDELAPYIQQVREAAKDVRVIAAEAGTEIGT